MSDCSREGGIGREERRWPLPSLAVLWIVNACERKPNRKKLSIHRELNFTNQIKIAIFVFHSSRLFNNLWYIFTKAEFLDTAVIATHISCEVLALMIWKKIKPRIDTVPWLRTFYIHFVLNFAKCFFLLIFSYLRFFIDTGRFTKLKISVIYFVEKITIFKKLAWFHKQVSCKQSMYSCMQSFMYS